MSFFDLALDMFPLVQIREMVMDKKFRSNGQQIPKKR